MPPIIALAIAFVASTIGITLVVGEIGLTIASNIIFVLGLTLISSALSPKPKSASSAWRGDSQQVTFNPNDPRKFALGRCATAGQLVTFQTWGANNVNIILIFRLCDHKTSGLVGGWWNGVRMTIGGGGAVAQANVGGVDHLWVTYLNGDWNQVADAELIANSGGRWTSNDRGRGVTYVKIKALYDQKAHPQGLSGLFQFIWEIDGAPLYDRRLDSSVGGSGTQRVNDQSTWTLSDNAAVAAEALLRGFRTEDTSVAVGLRTVDTFFGLNLNDADLPFADNVSAMNSCDEAVSLLAGGTEHRYRAAGLIDCSQTPGQVLQDLLAAQAGKMLTGVGRWVVLPGVVRTPVHTFTDDDFRIDGPSSYKDKVPLDTIVNAVSGRFADPVALYTAQPAPTRVSLSDQAEDGGPKADNFDLTYVTSLTQAQRCQEIHRRQGRRQRSAQKALPPEWIGLEAGDWIAWTSARYGWSLDFELVQNQVRTDDADFLMAVADMGETDATVFGWTPSTDELSRTTPAFLTSADATSPTAPAPGDWTLSATTETDSKGNTSPLLIFTGVCNVPQATGVVFRIGTDGVHWQGVGVEPRTVTSKRVPGIIGGQGYYGEVSYIINGVEGAALLLTEVTTGPLTPGTSVTIADGDILFDSGTPGAFSFIIPSGAPGFIWIEGQGPGGDGITNFNPKGSSIGAGAGAGGYGKHHMAVTPGVTVIAGTITAHGTVTATRVTTPALTYNGGTNASSSNGVGATASGNSLVNTTGHNGGRVHLADGGGAGPALVDQTTQGSPGTPPGGGGSGLDGGTPGAIYAGDNGHIKITAKTT